MNHGVSDVGSIVETVQQVHGNPDLFGKYEVIKIVAGSITRLDAVELAVYMLGVFRATFERPYRRLRNKSARCAPTIVTQPESQRSLPSLHDVLSSSTVHSVDAPAKEFICLYPDFASYQETTAGLRLI